ncbi:MAG: MFS transporter [Anaerolineae bacterium]|nr:MFS transporter [Anaerolineae bacterium]
MPRIQLLIYTSIRVVLNTAHRMIYPFLSIFARGLGVDIGVVSGLIANRAIVGSFTPFIIPFIEQRGRKFGMLLGLSCFIAAMGLVSFFPTVTSLGIALVLSMLGKAFFDPSLTAHIADQTPYSERGSAIAILEFAWSFAFILGVPAVGWLIARSGWASPFFAFTLMGVAAFLYIAFTLKSSTKLNLPEGGVFANIKTVFTSPVSLVAISIGLLVSTANELVNVTFGIWLEDSFQLKIAALGAASAIIGLSELGGEGLVFGFVDRLGKVRASGVGVIANCLAAILLPIIGRTQTGALIGLFLFYITFEFTIVSIIPLITEVMPNARVTMLSFAGAGHSIGRGVGALLAPGLYAASFSYIMVMAVLFNLIGLVAVWYVSRHHD